MYENAYFLKLFVFPMKILITWEFLVVTVPKNQTHKVTILQPTAIV